MIYSVMCFNEDWKYQFTLANKFAFWSSSRWPLATSMSSRRQISIPFGGRYRQVLLYMQVSKRFDKWAIDFVQMKFYENWVWDALRTDIRHYNSPLYLDDLMEDAAGVILSTGSAGERHPDSKVHGAHLGPTGPRWAPCWPHELCYLGSVTL